MPFTTITEASTAALPLRVNLWGEQKSGKTSFALTFPRPMHYFNFDHGVMELVAANPSLAEGLLLANYALPANPTLEQGEALLQSFVDDWYEAVETPGGTMVIDTATHLKELVGFVKMSQKLEEKIRKAAAIAAKKKEAFDPDMVQLMRPDYAPRNQLMNAILSLPALTDHKNVVFVWKAREKYSGNGAPTGQFEGDLFKDAPYIAQATLARRRGGLGKNVFFTTTIEDNRFDPTLNGEALPEDVLGGYEDLRGMLL
jgi:hypothetical protein